MLIHRWDAATSPTEWREWIATTDRFGMLAVGNLAPRGDGRPGLHPERLAKPGGTRTACRPATTPSVQFVCSPAVVDDPQGKVEIPAAQFADLQPEGDHPEVAVDSEPYGRMLPPSAASAWR